MVLPEIWRACLIPDQDKNKSYANGGNSQGKVVHKPIPNATLLSPVQHSDSQLVQVFAYEGTLHPAKLNLSIVAPILGSQELSGKGLRRQCGIFGCLMLQNINAAFWLKSPACPDTQARAAVGRVMGKSNPARWHVVAATRCRRPGWTGLDQPRTGRRGITRAALFQDLLRPALTGPEAC